MNGVIFNGTHNDSTPFGVNSKLTALYVPRERDFFVAHSPDAISICFDFQDGFGLLWRVFYLCLLGTDKPIV